MIIGIYHHLISYGTGIFGIVGSICAFRTSFTGIIGIICISHDISFGGIYRRLGITYINSGTVLVVLNVSAVILVVLA